MWELGPSFHLPPGGHWTKLQSTREEVHPQPLSIPPLWLPSLGNLSLWLPGGSHKLRTQCLWVSLALS